MELLTSVYRKVPGPAFDAADQMSDQVIGRFFPPAFLLLLGKHPDGIPYNVGLTLPAPSCQTPDQRFCFCIESNLSVIQDCSTSAELVQCAETITAHARFVIESEREQALLVFVFIRERD